jgi:hypothetical protein
MTASPADNLASLDRAMHLSNLRHEFEERTFYGAAVAREGSLPLADATGTAEAKRRLIDDAVAVAPLAAHIVRGSRIECSLADDAYACHGPVTCFRVHEILRKTRRHPEARIVLNDTTLPREELLAMYRLLVPNTNLEPLSQLTLFTLPRILAAAVAGGVVAGAWMGRQHSPETPIDFRAALIGAGLVAAGMSLLGQFALSRNVFKTAPWNAALYNDANLLLYRQDPAALHLARREFMKRNHFLKGGLNGRRYHERALAIESGAYAAELRRRREALLARKP